MNDETSIETSEREALPWRGEAVSWEAAKAISNVPEVDEAIAALLADNTADNATGLVQAVMQHAAPPARQAVALDGELPPAYMVTKLAMVMPVLQEARDALCALTEMQRKLHRIAPDLADRMDAAGTFSLGDWRAHGITPAGVEG